jgi:hypothetical protein
MIVAGMIPLAMIFAAVMFAAAVRRCKRFPVIGSLQRITEFISLRWNVVPFQDSLMRM